MPAASNAIAPKGGYNHASIYWLSPQTGSSTVGDIGIVTAPTSGTEYARFDGTGLSFRTNILRNLSGTSFLLAANTADGSDNAVVSIAGGGDALTAQGGVITLAGNEHAQAGRVVILAGVGGGSCTIGTAGNNQIDFWANNGSKATMSATGVFNLTALTASRGVYTDGSKNLSSTIARATWSPTITGSGFLTIGAQTIFEADYWYAGPYIAFRISAIISPTGSAASFIQIPHPVAGVADHVLTFWTCSAYQGGYVTSPVWNYDGTHIRVQDRTTTWTPGTDIKFFVQGFYRAV